MVRASLALIALAAGGVHADDGVSVGAAVGAGGQGEASYGALELRLDADWRGIRLGLGARGVWADGVFRRGDWARLADAVAIVRLLEASTEDGRVALAAGALAPARIAHLADGYRAALDDRMRTGVRGAVRTSALTLGLEIDDVIDPALVGGAVDWRLGPTWGVLAAVAVDPTGPRGVASAIEVGVARRWEATRRRLEAGGGVVGEPGDGLGVVGFGTAAIERRSVRWSARADLRAGNGTNGAAFGPLYRLERWDLGDRARAGVGGGLALEVAAPAGWLALGVRTRPGVGGLATVAAGAPMGRWVQAGGWLAASPRAAAGAAELRVAWASRLFSAVQLARMYATDEMLPAARWSATVWFGASTE